MFPVDPPARLLPEATERVAAVTRFVVDGVGRPTGAVELADGRVLGAIDHVVLATGYITSYPFLGPGRQAPATAAAAADEHVIVTADGCLTHNLHEDMFYIPDPTLVFVGVPYHVSTFSLFDFQAEVAARVLAGWAKVHCCFFVSVFWRAVTDVLACPTSQPCPHLFTCCGPLSSSSPTAAIS